MAESPSHKFGQIVGNLLEDTIRPVLQNFCEEHGLYLDVKGERIGVRSGKKVIWEDRYGNSHDLDFVIEKGGSATSRGQPVAFIEAAWRRYTKHSRNKAQEIQGAILPIADGYHWNRPFLGAVLAGVFTRGSLDQLGSVGFHVLYLSYESIVSAFDSVGINARFDESTPDDEFKACVEKIEALTDAEYDELKGYLVREEKELFDKFLLDLSHVLDRVLDKLIVLPLFGDEQEFETAGEALDFIKSFEEGENGGDFQKYEIIARYTSGDSINASFKNKGEMVRFLKYLAQ